MQGGSRRSFLLGSIAIAGSANARWQLGSANAAPVPPSIRHNAASSAGKAMLKIYADAVGKMMALTAKDPGNPTSWLFQWYTHGVKQPWQQPISTSFKQPEIARIYPNAADPHRALATTMWDTCTHYGQPQAFFLPWHRMYVFFFRSEEHTSEL